MKRIFGISLWIFGGFAVIAFAAMGLVGLFAYSARNFEKEQNEYFSKVEYFVEGNVIGAKDIGGSYYLIEIEPTKFAMVKNRIRLSDDYVGVYTADTTRVFIVAPLPVDFSFPLRTVGVNTRDRQFLFNDTSESTLRTAALYKHKLPCGRNYIPF